MNRYAAMAIDFNSINNNPANSSKPVTKEARDGAPAQAPATPAPVSPKSESVNLSQSGRTLSEAESALSRQPEIDDSKVESIRQALQDGSFKIDAEEVAQKMLDMDNSIFG
ncbi:MAG: flagellar biosynthesis anti-sigma factor FlgM [Halomonadaceae bacterium]|nr:MAG: flagellar biosynthesis anti-sigma factor FlgM [Halomonadaceae bacterium]